MHPFQLGKEALCSVGEGTVISDYKCQLNAIEDMREVMGDSFVDPREYKGIADN